jgi:hypothetical protein
MVKWLCHFFFIPCSMYLHAQDSTSNPQIDAAKKAFEKAVTTDQKVTTCFFIADNFMDKDQYGLAEQNH